MKFSESYHRFAQIYREKQSPCQFGRAISIKYGWVKPARALCVPAAKDMHK
jgi:hypothetical protein